MYNKAYEATKLRDEEAKERRRQQNRISQQRRRARMKEAMLAKEKTLTPNTGQMTTRVKTREQIAKDANNRRKAAIRQQKRRANMHPQKWRRENEKRMERYYRKKAVNSTDLGTSAKKRTTLASLLKGAYRTLRQGRDRLTLFKLQFIKKIMSRHPSATQRQSADYYQRHRPTYSTAVETFLEKNAVDFPGQRGQSTPKKVLTKTMTDLFIDFKKTHNTNISFTTFKRKRPHNLLLSKSRKFLQCLCEKCTNAMLIMDIVNPYLRKKDSGSVNEKVTNVDDLVKKTLCTSVTRACVDRECESCGVDGFMRGVRRELGENVCVEKEWKRWEKSEKCSKDLVSKRSTLKAMLDQLGSDLIGLSKHIKTAHWQRNQYQGLCANLPPGHAVLTVDFAENYLCKFQNEIQSVHWSYRQVSVHPCVFHYKCDKPGCHKVLIEYLIFLSDDLRHDSSFTKTVFENCIAYVEEKGLSCLHVFSDGCASQYKSRYAFNHINELQEKFPRVKITRNFFGSNHGKSLCDSCGGTVKNAATRAVLSGEHYIQSAKEMFTFCCDKLSVMPTDDCSHLKNRRSFVLLKDIVKMPSPPLKAIPGTQDIHCLCPLKEGSLMVKHLSCS